LMIGVEINPDYASAREVCEKLLEFGVLSKDTHGTVVRFAPPLTITAAEIREAMGLVRAAFTALQNERMKKVA
ncbi:MAG: aminotransferase class III-fold pyridoxal phosphate-dependent enzyme, partial [Betaproteobacteria bacterium]|nr:aminotransferase class III-fold pyridoxal phosphate-dependent enzyme [Betaproteobacteria bacterium]